MRMAMGWVLALAGVFAAAILILIFEHPRTLPRNDRLSD